MGRPQRLPSWHPAVLVATLWFSGVPGPGAGVAAEESPAPKPDPAPGVARSDVDRLVLKDGRMLEGAILEEDGESYALRVDGAVRLVRKGDVASVERAPEKPAGDGAQGEGSRTRPASGAPRREPRGEESARGETPQDLPAELRSWIATCIVSLGSSDAAVARSAAAALGSIGEAALPSVRRARRDATPPLSERLQRVERLLEGGEPEPPGEETPGARLRTLVERARGDLGLDPATTRFLRDTLTRYGREFQELRTDVRDGLLPPDALAERAGTLREGLRERLSERLTEEQVRAVDALVDGLVAEATERRRPPTKEPPPRRPDGGAPAEEKRP